MHQTLRMLALAALIGPAHLALAQPPAPSVAEINPIVEIYVGKTQPDGRMEVVFHLKAMRFYSNQRLYGCMFVNGNIVLIKEYNSEDSYVRGHVKLPGAEEEIVAYSGVISHPTKLDPHDHAALWKAFASSAHKPFRGKVKDRPKWWVTNPIKAKRTGSQTASSAEPASWKTSSYPYLKPHEIPEAVELASSSSTGRMLRFRAVWGLAISGYTRESADVLARVACDGRRERSLRGYAAMGLRNFTGALPKDQKQEIRSLLGKVLAKERARTPDSIIRALLAWGEAAYVNEVIGEKLAGHRMEVEVLARLEGKRASDRLWKLYEACPKDAEHYNRRESIGRALADRKDKRGIDILVAQFDTKDIPSKQYFHNTYAFLAKTTGKSFGYSSPNYTPALDEAIPLLQAWWKANGETFSFDPPIIRR